jgi:hypothetical protein
MSSDAARESAGTAPCIVGERIPGAPWSAYPAGYMITLRTYGTWLPGDSRGWVDRRRPTHRFSAQDPDALREEHAARRLRGAPFVFSRPQMLIVLREMRATAARRGWRLRFVNVRTAHVHVIITAACRPEKIATALKANATRALREAGEIGPATKVWSRHASTVYLWTEAAVDAACRYAMEEQGPDLIPLDD